MWFVVSLSLLLLAVPVWADVYKCPDGKGGTRFQNMPCIDHDKDPMIIGAPPQSRAESGQTDITTSLAALTKLHTQWNDTVKLAESTGRVALSGPIGALQDIKR
jgi:hypothetical protein